MIQPLGKKSRLRIYMNPRLNALASVQRTLPQLPDTTTETGREGPRSAPANFYRIAQKQKKFVFTPYSSPGPALQRGTPTLKDYLTGQPLAVDNASLTHAERVWFRSLGSPLFFFIMLPGCH